MWWWWLHDVLLASHSSPVPGWSSWLGCFWAADWFWDKSLLGIATDRGDWPVEIGEAFCIFGDGLVSVVLSMSWGLEHGFRIHEVWVPREAIQLPQHRLLSMDHKPPAKLPCLQVFAGLTLAPVHYRNSSNGILNSLGHSMGVSAPYPSWSFPYSYVGTLVVAVE